jgi:hypothetical protein
VLVPDCSACDRCASVSFWRVIRRFSWASIHSASSSSCRRRAFFSARTSHSCRCLSSSSHLSSRRAICSLCPGAISSMRSSTVYGRTCFAPITRNKFNAIYNKWRQRIREPDIRIHSNTQAWTKVPEFTSLVGLGELAVPFLLERLRQGDFVAVKVLEAVSRVPSRRLYPNPMPPIGTFGEQDVAQLWLSPQAAALARSQCYADLVASFNNNSPRFIREHCSAAANDMCKEGYQMFWVAPPPCPAGVLVC